MCLPADVESKCAVGIIERGQWTRDKKIRGICRQQQGGAPTEGLFDFNQCVLLRFGSS